MNYEFSGKDILALADLLRPSYEPETLDDDEQHVKSTGTVKKSAADPVKPKITRESEKEDESLTNEEKLEKALLGEAEEVSDWRKAPHWDVAYKQSVTPSDVFLQMGGKTQLTSSCEEMIITIDLPGESRPNIDVKVTKDRLELVSPQYRLNVPLPQPVDPQKGNAKWDSANDKLILTLIMDREFDYINF